MKYAGMMHSKNGYARALQVLGISGDSVQANAAFAKAQRLPFPLLTDEGNAFRKAFGVKGDLLGIIPGREVRNCHFTRAH